MHIFIIPKLGQGDTDVEIIKIMIKVGDGVKEGDAIVEVESEKANTQLESDTDGVIKEIFVSEGQFVKSGTTICEIEKN